MNRKITFVPIVILVLVLAGCASVPLGPPPAERWVNSLPNDVDIVLKARMAAVEPLALELMKGFGLDGKDGAEMISRTREIYMGIKQNLNAAPDFSIILAGNFPKAASALFTKQKGFYKQAYKTPYWTHETTGMQIALPDTRPGSSGPEGRALFISQGRIEEMLDAYGNPSGALTMGDGMPLEARKEFEVSDLAIFMPYPGKNALSGTGMSVDQFPIRDVWITLERTAFPDGDKYVLSSVFSLDSADRAKKFIPLFKLLVLGVMKKNTIDAMYSLKNDAVVAADGEKVRFEGLIVLGADLLKLMASLSGKKDG